MHVLVFGVGASSDCILQYTFLTGLLNVLCPYVLHYDHFARLCGAARWSRLSDFRLLSLLECTGPVWTFVLVWVLVPLFCILSNRHISLFTFSIKIALRVLIWSGMIGRYHPYFQIPISLIILCKRHMLTLRRFRDFFLVYVHVGDKQSSHVKFAV